MSDLLSNIGKRFPQLVKNLRHSANSQRFAQSYLLVGDDSQTLYEMALGLAQLINCTHRQADGTACGCCHNCEQLAKQNYLELSVVRPQSKSRMILIEQLNELMNFLSMTVAHDRKKIGIIVDAETMNQVAQNAFLKTLEEPDSHTLLILCTTRARLLLPTIKSRCRILSLRNNSKDYSWLKEKGLFESLLQLRPGCEFSIALLIASNLKDILNSLGKDAAKLTPKDNQHQKWDETEISAVMKKQLKSQEEAEQKSEYLKLREGFISAVQSWYNQVELATYGITLDKLPCQEILPDHFSEQDLPNIDALPTIRNAVNKLSICLSTNANESLAIDSFCLEIAMAEIGDDNGIIVK